VKESNILFNKTNSLEARQQESSEDYPTLRGLVRGYFHQDYDLISEDADEVVIAFRDETTPAVHQGPIDDIHKFIDRHGADEKELTGAFESIFTPETGFHRFLERTTREALMKVVEIVSTS
jgi:hypothetical protein